MKIFMAEDDMNIVTIAKIALEQLGRHQVQFVHDGQLALEKISKGSFDLIILDEMMPKMNGRDVCDEYVKRPGPKTPVIFMSANNRDLDERDPRPPVIGFISKPFDPMTLNSQIEELLSRSKNKHKEAV
jgi:two-component system alkaline phosphatase synthesis response regulator PhoP